VQGNSGGQRANYLPEPGLEEADSALRRGPPERRLQRARGQKRFPAFAERKWYSDHPPSPNAGLAVFFVSGIKKGGKSMREQSAEYRVQSSDTLAFAL